MIHALKELWSRRTLSSCGFLFQSRSTINLILPQWKGPLNIQWVLQDIRIWRMDICTRLIMTIGHLDIFPHWIAIDVGSGRLVVLLASIAWPNKCHGEDVHFNQHVELRGNYITPPALPQMTWHWWLLIILRRSLIRRSFSGTHKVWFNTHSGVLANFVSYSFCIVCTVCVRQYLNGSQIYDQNNPAPTMLRD